MIRCNICGAEKETPRQMHGHLVRWHYDEYKKVNFNMRDGGITSGAPELAQKKKKKYGEAPEGFRLLNLNNKEEYGAYHAGYRYIDNDEMCYTHEEAKSEGWI